MTAKTARLRPIPAIAVELDEGLRLRRASGAAGLQRVLGADNSRPHRQWSQDVHDMQMKARVAVTLIEDVFSHLRALEDLYEFKFREQIGLDELCFQVHQIKEAAEAMQPQ